MRGRLALLAHQLCGVAAATRYERDWIPHADWVVLEGIGHCPQLDLPLETGELILGVSAS